MEPIEKLKAFNIHKADPAKDIGLINQYALKELKPEDVMCFSLVLCDNEVDRDMEQFSVKSLEALSKMFVGKTGIKNHSWDTRSQVARLYRVELQKTAEKTSTGEQLVTDIRNERRREFVMQGQRWFDLRRYRVCQVYPQKKSITHDYTYYVERNSTQKTETHRFVLTEDDLSWTLPIPQEVLDFNTGMKNNGNQWRDFTVL